MTLQPLIDDVAWQIADGLVPYPQALAEMDARAAAIREGTAPERIWLLEHPPTYTAGTSAVADELLDARFPVYDSGRGGRYTYHGPGQRIAYVQIDLAKRGRDVRQFVHGLESWVIDALAMLGISARAVPDRIGIWTDDVQGREAKIGAIGLRLRRWVSLHGFSINVDPDLSHFSGIVPCGISAFPVTSLAALGGGATLADVDAALQARFPAFLDRITQQHATTT